VTSGRPAAVALDGIAKRFGAVVALERVTLEVGDGEFVCFLGPSGCGKTTLLRIIAGLERQNLGTVRMAGRDVSGLPPRERNYGIVFQSYALFPNLTVARNVAYGLQTRRAPRERLPGTLAALAHGAEHGAHIFRLHDVSAAADFLTVRAALRGEIEPRRDLALDDALRYDRQPAR